MWSARSLSALSIVIMSGAGCSDDPAKTCEATLCDTSLPPTCSGNEVRTCVGGTAYSYTACGSQQRCDDADGSAECVARACSNLGLSTCKTPAQVETCRADGSGRETIDCASTEKCLDGRCVDKDCQTGDAVCTDAGFVSCTSGVWTSGACALGNVCTLTATGPECGPKVCTPGTFRCDGNTSRFCDALGASETGTQCEGLEICVEGRCQTKVCGVDVPDATSSTDTEVMPEPARMTFKVQTQPTTFDQAVEAEFDGTREELYLKGQKGTRNILMIIENARQTLTGTFTETSPLFHGLVCWNSGDAAVTLPHCPEGFTHESSTFEIVIDSNDGRGGQVKGSFHAIVNDLNGDPVNLNDGTFVLNFR